ncbi:MAG TPA: nucleotide sugar dehydrogenase [Chloroflexota bacterium]|nr:nucleotide sugar dehydrogenase [Chloroflexota bacterium]
MTGETRAFIAAVRAGDLGVGVWGCGHIGASALFHLAVAGVRCMGYDVASERVEAIREGRFLSTTVTHPAPPAATPDIATAPLRISASTDWHDLLGLGLGLHLICVPTDQGPLPSTVALEDVLPSICAVIQHDRAHGTRRWPQLVIIESTIVPSWIDAIVLPALARHGLELGRDVHVGVAPRRDWFSGETYNLYTLPRIVGGTAPAATAFLEAFYSLICATVRPARDAHHAALTKVVENALRYVGITFANALAVGLPGYDTAHVLELAATKWNIPYYHPSLGIGGHCIPLAPQYLLAEAGADRLAFVQQALDFNDGYFERLYTTLLGRLLEGCRRVAVLGLAYTPDARMEKLSPAFSVVRALQQHGREVHLHDPYYSAEEIRALLDVPTLVYPDDLHSYDGIILVTAHTPYRELPIERYVAPSAVVIDNFGAWHDRPFSHGVRYHEVGTGI